MDYNEYLKSEAWQLKRSEALKNSGYKCQVCDTSRQLEVHHRTYESLGNEKPSDLTVLCRDCHELFHKGLPFSVQAKLSKLHKLTQMLIENREEMERLQINLSK